MSVLNESDIQDRWLWYVDEKLVAVLSGECEAAVPLRTEWPEPESVPNAETPPEPAVQVAAEKPGLECSSDTGAVCPQVPDGRRPQELAEHEFVGRNYEKALTFYRQALELAPERHSLHENIGACLFNLGRFPEARDQFERVLAQDATSADARKGLAWSLLHLGEADLALPLLESTDVLARAQALILLSRFDEAAAAYATLLESDPENAEAHFQLGYALFKSKQWVAAIEAFMNCLARQRNRVEGWIYLGLSQWAADKTEAAASSFEKALHRDPTSIAALRCRTALALATGDAEAATEYEAQLADLGETQPEFCYNLGVLQQSTNRLEEAAQSYRRAVTKKPTHGAALLNLGCLLMDLGRPEEAGSLWRTALSVDPAVLRQ